MLNLKWWQTLIVILVGAGLLALSQLKSLKDTQASLPLLLTGGALLLAARTRGINNSDPPAPLSPGGALVLLATLCCANACGAQPSADQVGATEQAFTLGPIQTHAQTPPCEFATPASEVSHLGDPNYLPKFLVARPPGTHWCTPGRKVGEPSLGVGETAIVSATRYNSTTQGVDCSYRSECVVLSPGTTLDLYWLQASGFYADWGTGPHPSQPIVQEYPIVTIRKVMLGPQTVAVLAHTNATYPPDVFMVYSNPEPLAKSQWFTWQPVDGSINPLSPLIGSIASTTFP